MAFSIESRVPFLTPALAEYVFSLPEEYVIRTDGTTKAVFREAMRGIVPDPVLDRRDKIGFAPPERVWYKRMNAWVEKVLASEVAREIPGLKIAEARKEWCDYLNGRSKSDFRIWRWINLIRWTQLFDISFDGL